MLGEAIDYDKFPITTSYFNDVKGVDKNSEGEVDLYQLLFAEKDLAQEFIQFSDDIVIQKNISISSSIDSKLMRLVDELYRQGETNWKDQGIDIPNSISIALSELIIKSLYKDKLVPFRITASAEGGICLVFKNKTAALYLEVYNDGEIGFIVEDFIEKKILQNSEIELQAVEATIKNFLLGE